ncbi:MAG TPA: hypothetical protein VMI75_29625, partial [Polyangiaceae bacterium]|nr:hypothetical protein [Polyangiaceae bacterium]
MTRSAIYRGSTTVLSPLTTPQGGRLQVESTETSHHEETYRPTDVDTPAKVAAALQRVQRHAIKTVRGARTLPINGGVYMTSQKLFTNTINVITHGVNGPVSWMATRLRATSSLAPVVCEIGQTSDGRLQLGVTANCIADIWCYPQPGLTNIGSSTKLAPPFTASVAPTTGAVASSGLSANPPVASAYTLVGNVGVTQYATAVRAAVYAQAANVASCGLIAGSLPVGTPWIVTLIASFLAPPTQFPALGVCVSDGVTSGTSHEWCMAVYAAASSGNMGLGINAKESFVGAAAISTLNNLGNLTYSMLGDMNAIHLRLVNDGVNLHFQYGDGAVLFDFYTMATPTGLTNYGFVMGDTGNSNARCNAILYENMLAGLSVPQSSISACTSGAAPTVTTSAPHDLQSGDWVAIHGAGG